MRRRLSRELVAETALEVAQDEGIDKLSMRHVAARLGVVPSALYGHIDDHDDLYRAIAERAYSQLTAALEAASAGEDDAVARVRAILRAYYRFAGDDRVRFRILTRFRPQFSAEWSDDQIPAGASAYEVAANAVRVAVATGRFGACNAEMAALAIFATVRGTTMFALEAEAGQEEANRAIAFAALDTLIDAFAAPGSIGLVTLDRAIN